MGFVDRLARTSDRFADKYPFDVAAVRWQSTERQTLRFGALAKLCYWQGESVLDAGCGFGDFFHYCRFHDLDINYLGIDVSQQMITQAKTAYPGGRFIVGNFMTATLPFQPDYVVCSGGLNVLSHNHDQFIEAAITRFWQLATKGVAFNLLEKPKKKRGVKDLYYADRDTITTFCRTLTNQIEIRDTYLHGEDFSVLLKKPDSL